MPNATDIDFFTDVPVQSDPNTYFKQLRAQCPVLREPHHGVMMVTGYDEAVEVFGKKGKDFSSCIAVNGPIPPLPFKPEGNDISAQLAQHQPEMPWSAHLVSMDGTKHFDHRTILTSLLTHSRLKANEEYMGKMADRLIDKFIETGECEVVSQYAHAASTLVIADLLGVPEEDRDDLVEALGPNPTQVGGDQEFKLGPDPLSRLEDRFVRYLSERRGKPRGDMLSDLANARFRDGSVPPFESLVRLGKFVFGAGQDTSARLVTFSFKILGECPDLQQRLRAEPQRIPDFIEETLRMESPTKALSRLARTTTEVGGVAVPAGTVTTVALGAANRDPRHFPDPDTFNIDRPNVRDHIAFSRGSHACPGAPLARMEGRITLERFLARMSDIRISEKHHGPPNARRYDYEPTYLLHGLKALHIAFTRA